MDFDDVQKGNQPRSKQSPPVKHVSQTLTQPRQAPATQPSRKQFSFTKFYTDHKKSLVITGGVLTVIIVISVVVAILSGGGSEQKPTYKTVLPAGESISELGGWKIVSPPESEPVYAFADTIDGTAITVSQQPAPRSESGKIEPIAAIAEKFFATQKIDGTDAYLGTSSNGPQSALFIRKGTLIMIKSQQNISNKSWATYINNLR